ncbi:MAG: DUF3050 domain-containing protein [Verrucomicrobia bacterium]|nr:DUF3050 domain-containing protein [Verrucomicrobiota bacterium]
MSDTFDSSSLNPLRAELVEHPVFHSVTTLPRLRVFMEHHVFPVWDFMSLLKWLQQAFAPHGAPWLPDGDGDIRRFVNEIVTEEESDQALAGSARGFISHFDMYRQSMNEIGADSSGINGFLDCVAADGLAKGLARREVLETARQFMRSTFDVMDTGQPHRVAGAFALGREDIVPGMFKALLAEMKIRKADAPTFHYYLTRHTHLDEESHGPMAIRMLARLCDRDPRREQETLDTARSALQARLVFWDGVHRAIEQV